MKNILKKLLLLFVIGMLGQTYIDNTCRASKQAQLQFGVKLEEFDFETIETFNPDKFWTAGTYAPCLDSKIFNHSSRCALAFVSNKDRKAYVKIFDGNFIAKGNDFELNKTKCKNWIKCKHNQSGFTTPRVHSEIAFLQELTKNTNPNKINDITFLTKFDKYKTSDRIIILIRNSFYIPCYWDGDPKDPGITCMNYIADFCGKLKKLTNKKITCIIQYEKDYPNFAEKRKEEEMKKQKNMIISKINSDENHITEIENFYGRKAIIYCY